MNNKVRCDKKQYLHFLPYLLNIFKKLELRFDKVTESSKVGTFLRHSVVLIPTYIDTKSTTIAQEVPEL